MKHEMKLREVYFEKIKEGTKVYEIRLNDEKRQLIDVGDLIVFKKKPDLNDSITTEVKDLIYFSSFEEMAKTLPLNKIGFEQKSIEQTISIYHQFYTKDEEEKYGVVAIKVKLFK